MPRRHTTAYRQARESAGLKLAEVAAQIDYSYGHIYLVELAYRQPSRHLANALAELYRVSVDDLIDTTPMRSPVERARDEGFERGYSQCLRDMAPVGPAGPTGDATSTPEAANAKAA